MLAVEVMLTAAAFVERLEKRLGPRPSWVDAAPLSSGQVVI
jgi:hypothetical protein